MNFSILLFVLLLNGSILAQDAINATDIKINRQTQLVCVSDMCDFLLKFGAMEEKLKATESRLEDSETRLTNLENQVLELKNKERTKVVFSAAAGGNGQIGPYNANTVLIYRTVITNIGSAYSHFTGIFTAPVAGIYYFTFFYHAGGLETANLTLIKNNQVVVNAYDHKSLQDGADNGGNAVFLQLQEGDQVYMRLGAYSQVWGYNQRTTFSGLLVSQV
ncbi:complement C1q tumor necrosis factor-related protein 3-like [Anabas testudineus]|uniref:C1q domain-containing protein n=1 Tax=Anabas testudineus TaxID=64144 RepID=A0A3Q1IIQ9_ANATE|nr:complement C1q tumor necrosis factor-related protein 3-like [Anabas testudineus]